MPTRDRVENFQERTERVLAALENNGGVLLPAIIQLMAEAWEEGWQTDEGLETNPYWTARNASATTTETEKI